MIEFSLFQNAKIVFYDIKYTSNPSLIANMTASVFNDSNGDSRINYTTTLLVDLARNLVIFSIAPPENQNPNNVVQGNFDPCKVSKGVLGGFVVKMIQDSLDKYSNYKFGCGMKKGIYYGANFNVDDSMMPLHFFGQKLRFVADFNIKAKTTKQKSFVQVFALKVNGIVV